MSFFAIHIPTPQDSNASNEFGHVFTNKQEAFAMLKNYKEARLKVFSNEDDAIHFSQNGLEITATSSSTSFSQLSPALHKTPFRGPKVHELMAFRKSIEQDKYEDVEGTIWTNPRFLVGSGDTPTIYKESFRYNALHVATLAKNARMCKLILQTVANSEFVQLLQGSKEAKTCEEVSSILLDLYLNMPEKGRNETPLHLAVKFGAVDVVEVLTSYPQCTITANAQGQFPKDIICMRMDNPTMEIVNQISALLEERFYVPVIRSIDNSTPPIVGEPFSPMNPPNLIFDPLSPDMEIQAYAGPMNKEQAVNFRRRWKTPPRVPNSPSESFDSSPNRSFPIWCPASPAYLNHSSTPKSMEKIKGARQLFPNKIFEDNVQNNNHIENQATTNNSNNTNKNNNNSNLSNDGQYFCAPKNELFLNYRDKRLTSLDDSISSVLSRSGNQQLLDSPMYKERHVRLIDAEKGLEIYGRQLAKEQNIAWKEYWNFLGCFVDIGSTEGLRKLEAYLGQRNEKQFNANGQKGGGENVAILCSALDKLELREPKSLHRNGGISFIRQTAMQMEDSPPIPFSNTLCAYLCVEKSCQVYAKRMTKTIIQHAQSVISINDTLRAELKRLKSLIDSYKKDKRFVDVNFEWTHSRFAKLIVAYLKSELNCDLLQHKDNFARIIQSTERLIETSRIKNESEVSNGAELLCLLRFVVDYIENKDNIISPEVLTTEAECNEIWHLEKMCNCSWITLEISKRRRQNSRNLKNRSLHYEPFNVEMRNSYRDPNRAESDDDTDDEEFVSDSDSENELFYTPPESPSGLIIDSDDSDNSFEDCDKDQVFKNYILGDEPTKTDLDILNALHNIEIDPDTYPKIVAWKTSILQHSSEERNNFPSPSVVVKKTSSTRFGGTLSNDPNGLTSLRSKRLAFSPVKRMSPFSTNYLRPSVFHPPHSCESDNASGTFSPKRSSPFLFH